MPFRFPALSIILLAWAVSLMVPGWWESPAFGTMLLPLWVWSVALVVSVGLIQQPGDTAKQLFAARVGLTTCSAFCLVAGLSVLWWTISTDQVSAIGSAIAWLGMSSFTFRARHRATLKGIA